jgi:Flp pilus assembly protein TadG
MMLRLGSFCSDKRGNFGMTLALLTAPLCLAIGSSIDYGMALSLQTQLQQAADSAAVGSLAEQSVGVLSALQNGTSGQVVVAEGDARRLFLANLDPKYKTYISDVAVDIVRENNEFVSKVTYKAAFPTSFMMMFGINSVQVSGTAQGTFTPALYIDFYMMLDNSPSMGLGATTADIQKLEANTPDTCAFACHIEGSTSDYYSLAKSLNVTTRIQVVSQATKQMLATAESTRRYSDQYRAAVYSMGAKATNVALTSIASMSSNLTSVGNLAAKIDLMSIPYQGYDNDQQTDFDKMLQGLKTDMGSGGTGINSSDRQKVLFLVTDGVNDSYKPSGCKKKTQGAGRCQSPVDTDVCTKIKDKNVRIAILYTTYLDIDNNGWYRTWIKPFRSEIGTQLEACATPGLYFEVSPSQGISEAMNALFMKVVKMPRLSS